MNKVLISTSRFGQADPKTLEALQENGLSYTLNPYGRKLSESEVTTLLQNHTALIAGLEPLNENVFRKNPQLKAIARVGVGMDNVDLDAAKAHNIKISNTPEAPAKAVAEMTLACLLNLSRHVQRSNKSVHAGQWEKILGRSLSGLNILLIGFGRIGQEVTRLLNAFGNTPSVYDPHLASITPIDTLSFSIFDTLEAGLANADVVSLHASGDTTILGAREFAMMRDGCILLNAARGNLVDEASFITALDEGRIGQAWIDTYREEPYHGPLCAYDNVLLTPHAATYSAECRREMEWQAVQNLLKDLKEVSHA